jgi:hypothetical protein
MLRQTKRLGEILVDLQVLSPLDVERVLNLLQRRGDRHKFGQMARDMGLLRDEHILAALAVQMELFPRIGEWTFEEILQSLQEPEPVKSSVRAG